MNRTIKFTFIVLIVLILLFSISFPINATNVTPAIDSEAAYLMDAKTGKVIYEKNANEKKYPASTTKIMTAILALENCNLQDKVIVSHDAISAIPDGYSNAELQVDEQLTVEQLLNLLLIPSANDAGYVLAEHIAGSIPSFASMMNTKAQELGCKDTNFTNPSGIQDSNHYSTAHDLALIGQYCMKNDTFRSIVRKTSAVVDATNKHDKRIYPTTNSLLKKGTYHYSYAIGIKTGYTKESGSCLVAEAQKNGLDFISVVLGGKTYSNGTDERFKDTIALFEYGFNNYEIKTIKKKGSIIKQIQVSNAKKDSENLNLLVEHDIEALTQVDTDISNIPPEIEIKENLKGPVFKDDVVGNVSYTVDGTKYTSNLIAESDVPESQVVSIIVKISIILFVLVLLACITKKTKKKKSRRR